MRDVRFGERWTVRQRLKNDATYAALRVGDAALRALPRGAGERLLRGVARLVVRRSRVARGNVAAVFPSWSEAARTALLERHAERLAHHAAAALDGVWQRRAPELLLVRAESLDVLDRALAGGRGVLLVSAHLGAWERVAQTLAARTRFAAVVREPYDPRLGRWLGALRAPVATIPRGSSSAARAMLRLLRSGGVLGVPMDLRTRGVETALVPFLGLPTDVVTGPARLALHAGAAVVVATYTHRAGREELRIEPVELPAGSGAAAATAQLAAALSEAILRCPEEWLWLHPRWTTPGLAPLYSEHGRGRGQAEA